MEATRQQETRMDNQGNAPKLKSFLTVKDFSIKHPVWTQPSLRWLIFNRESNGFAPVFRKVGKKRILIDEAAFFEMIDNSRMAA